ncbi:hypothetical protein LY76DRAFT_225701 [Colletotrichum caudatum]|nr:hypothetical protein LY76DRAFT_225701 [Colletotrichum caudatum]
MTPEQRESSSQAYFKRAQDLLQFCLWDLARMPSDGPCRMIAITHGRPAMISDQLAPSVVLPSIPDAGDTTENGTQLDAVSPRRLRYRGFFHKSLELYEVIHHTVLAFYLSASPSRSPTHPSGAGHNSQRSPERPELDLGKASQLDRRLTKWEKSLPSFLEMSEPETTLDEVFRRQAVILRIR